MPPEPLFEDASNAIQSLFERPINRVKYPMVNTDTNIYDIMNNG